MRQLPHLQDLYETYKNQGLHVFQVEAQRHSETEIQLCLEPYGTTFPSAQASWSDVPVLPPGTRYADYAYFAGALPSAYLIGVDGKVIWHGGADYDEAIQKELKKVKYPGLFVTEFPQELSEASKAFADRKFGAAVATARNVLEKQGGDSAPAIIREAVAHLIAKADEEHAWRLTQITDQIDERLYTEALGHLDAVAAEFKGDKRGGEAEAHAKALREDPAIRTELEVDEARAKLFSAYAAQSRRDRDPSQLAADLRKLAAKHPDTGAGERAEYLASDFDD